MPTCTYIHVYIYVHIYACAYIYTQRRQATLAPIFTYGYMCVYTHNNINIDKCLRHLSLSLSLCYNTHTPCPRHLRERADWPRPWPFAHSQHHHPLIALNHPLYTYACMFIRSCIPYIYTSEHLEQSWLYIHAFTHTQTHISTLPLTQTHVSSLSHTQTHPIPLADSTTHVHFSRRIAPSTFTTLRDIYMHLHTHEPV